MNIKEMPRRPNQCHPLQEGGGLWREYRRNLNAKQSRAFNALTLLRLLQVSV